MYFIPGQCLGSRLETDKIALLFGTSTSSPPFPSFVSSFTFPIFLFGWRAYEGKVDGYGLIEEFGTVEICYGGLSGRLCGIFDECIALVRDTMSALMVPS